MGLGIRRAFDKSFCVSRGRELDEALSIVSKLKPDSCVTLEVLGAAGSGKSWFASALTDKLATGTDRRIAVAQIDLREYGRFPDQLLHLAHGLQECLDQKSSFLNQGFGAWNQRKERSFRRLAYAIRIYWQRADPWEVRQLQSAYRTDKAIAAATAMTDVALGVASMILLAPGLPVGGAGKVAQEVLEHMKDAPLLKEYPELDGLAQMDDRQLRREICRLFAADLNLITLAAQNELQCPVVLVIDNADSLVAASRHGLADAPHRWLTDIAMEARGIMLVLLGRAVPALHTALREEERDGEPIRFEKRTLIIGQMKEIEARGLLTNWGVRDEPLVSEILNGPREPLLIAGKCAWVLAQTDRNGRLPAPEQIPKTLGAVYTEQLLGYSEDERKLLAALATLTQFDEVMLTSLATELGLIVSGEAKAMILAETSASGIQDKRFHFHDTFRQHLLDHGMREWDGWRDGFASVKATVLANLIHRAAREHSVFAAARLLQEATLLAQPPDDSAAMYSDEERALIGELATQAAEVARQIAARGAKIDAIRLTLDVIKTLKTCIEQEEAFAQAPQLLSALLVCARLACTLLAERWSGTDPEQAIDLVATTRKCVDPLIAGPHGAALLPQISAEYEALLVAKVAAQRALPLGTKNSMLRLHRRSEYLEVLERAVTRLVKALEGTSASSELRLFAASAASHLSHEFGKLSKVERANLHFAAASRLFGSLSGTGAATAADPAAQTARARHLLYPPGGAEIPRNDLKETFALLELVRKAAPLSIEGLELWTRALIRLALKRKAEQIPSSGNFYSSLDRALADTLNFAEQTRAEARSSSDRPDFDAGVVSSAQIGAAARIVLRILRKRKEMGVPLHARHEEALRLVLEAITKLDGMQDSAAIPILKELPDLLAARLTGTEKFFVEALTTADRLGPRRQAALTEIFHQVFGREPAPGDSIGAACHAALHARMITQASTDRPVASEAVRSSTDTGLLQTIGEALKNGSEFREFKQTLGKILGGRAFTSAERARSFAIQEVKLARELIGSGQQKAGLPLLLHSCSALWRHGADNLEPYRKTANYLLDTFWNILPEADLQTHTTNLRIIEPILDRNPTIVGSLVGMIQTLGEKSPEAARLAFQAMAIADKELSADLEIRRQARTLFARRLCRRFVELNESYADKARGWSELHIDDAAIENFAAQPSDGLAEQILALLHGLGAVSAHPSSVLIARIHDVVPSGPNAGVLFEHKDDPILVRQSPHKALISRALYQQLNPRYPEWQKDHERPLDAVRSAGRAPEPVAELHLLNVIKGSTQDGVRALEGTMIGRVFVQRAIELLLPGLWEKRQPPGISQVINGASNSCAVVRVRPAAMSIAMARGVMTKLITELCGLRRVVFVPMSHPQDPLPVLSEMKHFTNNFWQELRIVEESSAERLIVYIPEDARHDVRKFRTWKSMFHKAFPNVYLDIRDDSDETQPTAQRLHRLASPADPFADL